MNSSVRHRVHIMSFSIWKSLRRKPSMRSVRSIKRSPVRQEQSSTLEEKTLGRPNHELQEALPHSLSGPQSSVASVHGSAAFFVNNAGLKWPRKCAGISPLPIQLTLMVGEDFVDLVQAVIV